MQKKTRFSLNNDFSSLTFTLRLPWFPWLLPRRWQVWRVMATSSGRRYVWRVMVTSSWGGYIWRVMSGLSCHVGRIMSPSLWRQLWWIMATWCLWMLTPASLPLLFCVFIFVSYCERRHKVNKLVHRTDSLCFLHKYQLPPITFHLLPVLKASSCFTSSGLSSITSAILVDKHKRWSFKQGLGDVTKYLTTVTDFGSTSISWELSLYIILLQINKQCCLMAILVWFL